MKKNKKDYGNLGKYLVGVQYSECGDGPGQIPCPPEGKQTPMDMLNFPSKVGGSSLFKGDGRAERRGITPASTNEPGTITLDLGEDNTDSQNSLYNSNTPSLSNNNVGMYVNMSAPDGFNPEYMGLDKKNYELSDAYRVDPMIEVKANTFGNTDLNKIKRDAEEKEANANTKDNFSPYGVDLPTAATIFGQSLESGNVGMGVASGLKLGAGIARNIFSGMGLQRTISNNRNETRDNPRDTSTGEDTKQWVSENGGMFKKYADGGIKTPTNKNPTKEDIKSQMEKAGWDYLETKKVIEALKNGEQGLFNKDVIGDPMELAKNLEIELYKQQQLRDNLRAEYRKFEDGGEVTQEELMTGEVMTGVSENNTQVQPNSELEQGEHIITSENKGIKVEGKNHEQGGEKVELQDGDRVISNNLELKGTNAKAIRDEFGVKVKAKDTYAKAVDKVYKEIGLEKIIKEEEDVNKKIKEQEENVGDDTTKNLNLQFLYGKRNKIQKEKEQLEPKRIQALETIFNLQEESKPKEEQSTDKFEDGGIMKIADKYGISKEEAMEMIQEFRDGGYKKYQEGGEVIITDPETGEKKAVKRGSPEYKEYLEKGYEEITEEGKAYLYNKDFEERQSTGITDKQVWETNKDNVKDKYGSFEEYRAAADAWRESQKKLIEDKIPITEEQATNELSDYNENDDLSTNKKQSKDKKEKSNLNFDTRPDQGILPPSGVIPSWKAKVRLDRPDVALASPERAIEENNRAAQRAIANIQQNMSDSQAGPAIEAVLMQTQANNAKIASQYEEANTGRINQNEAQRAQAQGVEETTNVNQALGYEQRMQTAEAKTEENIRNFFDFNRKVGIQNFNDARRQNTINQMFENFDMDTQGNIIVNGRKYTQDELNTALEAYGNGLATAPTTEKKKKKSETKTT